MEVLLAALSLGLCLLPLLTCGQRPVAVAGGGCPERNGRFPVADQCDAYIECQDGVPELQLCPDGLMFNDRARFFAYPCQYPTEVDCGARTRVQPAQPTALCPHQFGYYRLGDARSCGQFMVCASGAGHQFDCPEGLAFNEQSLRCDWPDQVQSCDAEAYLGFSCPQNDPNSIFAAEGFRYFRSAANCQKYFLCYRGRPRLLSCAEDEAYNELTGACDAVENVTGCAFQSKRQAESLRQDFFLQRNQLQ